MKLVRTCLVVGFVLAAGVLSPAVASAETLSASGKIQLVGRVAPAHYIIVDAGDTITQIISNTSEETVPMVYKNKLQKGSEQILTPEIYVRYLALVPAGSSHPGTLYQLDVQKAPAKALQQNLTPAHGSSSNVSAHIPTPASIDKLSI